MDVRNTIDLLREELGCIRMAITALERMAQFEATVTPTIKSRRGRKTMGAEERLIVSARMKRYWASRHQDLSKGKPQQRNQPAGERSGTAPKAGSEKHASNAEKEKR